MRINRLYKSILQAMLVTIMVLAVSTVARAQTITAADLIGAVNSLRSSQGLKPLEIDPALMASAQGHSEYQAALGYWTHEGQGGSTARDRAIAAGFGGGLPVTVSENIAMLGSIGTIENLLYKIWADSTHWNTMTDPLSTRVGAGVAEKDGNVYITMDFGSISGSVTSTGVQNTPSQPAETDIPSVGTPIGYTRTPAGTGIAHKVLTVTPQEDGSIIHIVQPKEAVYSIASAYGVSANQIFQLNNLSTVRPIVFVGQKIVVRGAFTPTLSPTATATPKPPTRTARPTLTKKPAVQAATAGPSPTSTNRPLLPANFKLDFKNPRSLGVVIVIICGLGLLTVILSSLWSKPVKK